MVKYQTSGSSILFIRSYFPDEVKTKYPPKINSGPAKTVNFESNFYCQEILGKYVLISIAVDINKTQNNTFMEF